VNAAAVNLDAPADYLCGVGRQKHPGPAGDEFPSHRSVLLIFGGEFAGGLRFAGQGALVGDDCGRIVVRTVQRFTALGLSLSKCS
jgi:hypothetical protein